VFYDADLFFAARSPSLVVRVLSLPRGYERHHAGGGGRWTVGSKFLWVSNMPQTVLWLLRSEIKRAMLEDMVKKLTVVKRGRAPEFAKEPRRRTFRKRKHHQVSSRRTRIYSIAQTSILPVLKAGKRSQFGFKTHTKLSVIRLTQLLETDGQRSDGKMGQVAISCIEWRLPRSLPELR
jgi:hypothetical protein